MVTEDDVAGTELLRRTYDVGNIKPRIWFLPILFVFPSFGLINYCILRLAGADIPSPIFSLHQRLLLAGVDLLACHLHGGRPSPVGLDLQQFRQEPIFHGAVPLDLRPFLQAANRRGGRHPLCTRRGLSLGPQDAGAI